MASATPTRRVLSDLNANTPLSRQGTQGLKAAISPAKPKVVGNTLLQTSQAKAAMFGSIDAQTGFLGAKRKSPVDGDEDYSSKRLKAEGAAELEVESNTPLQLLDDDVREIPGQTSARSHINILGIDDDHISAPTSPASSFASQDNIGMNDSQNTTITIPDDVPLPARSSLTREELRQKARDMKLRLSLASYKVRTNQMDIPISRLEIRSSTLSSNHSSFTRTTMIPPQTQISRPSTAPSIPNINLQRPSTEKKRPQPVTIPSSPPAYRSAQDDSAGLTSPSKAASNVTRGGFATPLLPRQHEGLLNPPSLGSPAWGSDLTSSVVKGRAADGLLSLMRQ